MVVGAGVGGVALKTLGFLVTVVVKTTLDRIKKLDSDLQKSCREGTAETLSLEANNMGVLHIICIICFGK